MLSFEAAVRETEGVDRTVLLGNGFSIGQSEGQFSYSNLLEKSDLAAESPIRKVFTAFGTVDFEKVISALENASLVEAAYGDGKRADKFNVDAVSVREALVHAIRAVHPGIRYEITREQYEACGEFLKHFQTIFTLNYDLLLYWVILECGRFTDGFGLGEVRNGLKTFNESAYCSTHYLHGALHLFLNDQQETQKQLLVGETIVEDISNRILRNKRLPLFVAEGTAAQKMGKINSVPYLRFCLDRLRDASGCLFVYGHSVSNQDNHIYSTIFESNLQAIYFCVHEPQHNLQDIREKIAPFSVRNAGIEVNYIDAGSANVWGDDA